MDVLGGEEPPRELVEVPVGQVQVGREVLLGLFEAAGEEAGNRPLQAVAVEHVGRQGPLRQEDCSDCVPAQENDMFNRTVMVRFAIVFPLLYCC